MKRMNTQRLKFKHFITHSASPPFFFISFLSNKRTSVHHIKSVSLLLNSFFFNAALCKASIAFHRLSSRQTCLLDVSNFLPLVKSEIFLSQYHYRLITQDNPKKNWLDNRFFLTFLGLVKPDLWDFREDLGQQVPGGLTLQGRSLQLRGLAADKYFYTG